MASDFTKIHYDFGSLPWLTSPRKPLELEAVALGLIRLPPREGYTFTHSHRQQEEVYIVIEGDGVMEVNQQSIDLTAGDMVRVSAAARRALKAGEHGLFVICSGAVPQGYPKNPNARYMIDDGIPHYDDIPSWYQGRQDIVAKNDLLRQRMERARARRGRTDEEQ